MHLDLFFDESGTFEEGNRSAPRWGLDSQLAGIVAPRGQLTEAAASDILGSCFTAAGLNLTERVHGAELSSGASFDRLIMSLAEAIRRRGWQPVRLVNEEREVYGDHAANYTNMVAELVYRILMVKRKHGAYRGSVRIIAARVYRPRAGDCRVLDELSPDDYIRRLREYLTRLQVRMGLPEGKWHWELEGFKGGSGRSWPELQICDLLSNGSYRDCAKLGPEAKEALIAAFGKHDFSLRVRELFERVDVLLGEQALGPALLLLLGRLSEADGGGPLRDGATERLADVATRLAGAGARVRNMHLAEVVGHLEHVVESHESSQTGFRMARFALAHVVPVLEEKLAQPDEIQSLAWFSFALHRLALTASNHCGALTSARIESEEMDRFLPQLAGRWEYAPLLISGLLAKAVHLTDSMEYVAAAHLMEQVAQYYRELSGLFNAALPQVFPEAINSDLRGMALGTWLQAEMYAGLFDASRLNRARAISEDAIREFVDADDKQRQYQYRCQIETYAGDYAAAREFLAKGLGCPGSTHANIAHAISQLGAFPAAQGFALLHWLRLGAAACIPVVTSDGTEFLSALRQERLLFCDWCTGKRAEYPVHGIYRQAAAILAAQGQDDAAMSAIAHQRRLVPLDAGKPLLNAVHAATLVEVAGLLWRRNRAVASGLLDSGASDRLGARQVVHSVLRQCQSIPALVRVLTRMDETAEAVVGDKTEDKDVRQLLWTCSRPLAY